VHLTRCIDRPKCLLLDLISGGLLIEVFVRSVSPYMDVETCKEMSQHPYCAPGSNEALISGSLSKFKGRVFLEADSKVLEYAVQVMGKTKESVKIYDLSRMIDGLKAMRHGIRSTPVLVMNGKKYESLEEILQVLSNLKQS